MSQAKVDRYKLEKRNRASAMRREKRRSVASRFVLCVFIATILIWAGLSAWAIIDGTGNGKENIPVYTVDASPIDNFLGGLPSRHETT